MQRYSFILKFVIILLFVLSLLGCATSDSRVQYKWNVIHNKNYNITGRVVDYKGSPIKNCQVYLIQRNLKVKNKKNINVDAQILKVNHISDTDIEGQYYFTFEPVIDANDLWVSFLDPKNVFEYKSVCINNELGDTILQHPGNNPVLLNIVLDKSGME
ncbi:MAG: hypothetical protein KAR45_14970 [Desulfobacteraceae bacterium]|nr:hypothetical protein [Desulfobacteraceae bacterium]